MDPTLNVLLVEDNPAHAKAIKRALESADPNIKVQVVATLAAFRQAVAACQPDLAIMDLNLPDGRAVEVLTLPTSAGPFPILIMTSYGNEQVAVEALKSGALDYVVKSPQAFTDMPHTVERAMREWRMLKQHQQTEENLRKSEENFRRSLDESPLGVRVLSAAGKTIYANRALLDLYGYDSLEEINSVPINERYTPQSYGEFKKRRKVREEGNFGPGEYEISIIRKNGEVRQLQVFRKAILWNNAQEFQAIYQDISERKKAETQREAALAALQASLAEKNILLKEIHHRVKNNLMSIIGLIQMQEIKVKNETLSALLLELEGRVRAMALVHENLHKSENLARIDMQNYLETMIAQINTLQGPERDINFRVQATGVEVGLDIAIPCGLILNELITNACKYAFPGGKPRSGARNCEIAVSVNQDDTVFTLAVADNGVGLPAGLDWEQAETLGLRLVKMLSQQLKGIMEIERTGGTTFRLRFARPACND